MRFEKIKWCLNKKKGIRLVEPNDSISNEYLKEAFSDFEMVEKSNLKWKTVTAYYSCYNAVYSILMKIGIKSEIHDCTIALMEVIGFEEEEISFLNFLKKERVGVQYYLNDSSLEIDKEKVLGFLNKCKEILIDLNDNKINEIRELLEAKDE